MPWYPIPSLSPMALLRVQNFTLQDILGAHLVRCFTAPRSLSTVSPGTIAHICGNMHSG